jgi:hypothetical protein
VLPSRLPPKPSSISRCQCAVTVDSCVVALRRHILFFLERKWMDVRDANLALRQISRFVGEDLNLL